MNSRFRLNKYFGIAFSFLFILFFIGLTGPVSADEGFGFPSRSWGIGFGNLKNFNGLRFNFIDNDIETINGINVTLWKPSDKQVSGKVNGLSLGVIPSASILNGIQLGLAGAGAKKSINGITLGLIGAGSGENMTGINIGGIGVGSGGNLTGINIGGLGAGCGDTMTGINIGGLGVGAGNNLVGINLALAGVGAGQKVTGINIGGLGVGCGEDLTGINIGGLGVGAGDKMTGLNIGGLAVGAGDTLTGLSIGGLAVGAPEVRGLVFAGAAAGGKNLKGAFFSLGTVMVKNNGVMKGLSVSAFNFIKGTQKGVAIGIVNYAYRLRGLQIGLINIVRDNPAGRNVLPIINWNF